MKRALLIGLAALAAIAAVVVSLRRRPETLEDTAAGERVVSERPLDSMTRDELYELARERDIPGRSKMNKGELLSALNGTSS